MDNDTSSPPVTLGPYEIRGEIGRGGMAIVYQGIQPSLNRTVAIKVLPEQFAGKPELLARFEREGTIIAQLNHPSIVQVIDRGRDGNTLYIVMEFVDGGGLDTRLAGGALPLPDVLDWSTQICDALDYAHGIGVVHRDLKPSNILIEMRTRRPKITDFGIAQLETNTAGLATLTLENSSIGTMNYMSPEQRQDAHRVDHRTDIFSFGVILYQMLTGKLPLGHFKLPSFIRSDLPIGLDNIVKKCLAEAPDDRYQNAAEIRDELQRLTGHHAGSRDHASGWHGRVHLSARQRLYALTAVAVALLAGLALMATSAVRAHRRQAGIGGGSVAAPAATSSTATSEAPAPAAASSTATSEVPAPAATPSTAASEVPAPAATSDAAASEGLAPAPTPSATASAAKAPAIAVGETPPTVAVQASGVPPPVAAEAAGAVPPVVTPQPTVANPTPTAPVAATSPVAPAAAAPLPAPHPPAPERTAETAAAVPSVSASAATPATVQPVATAASLPPPSRLDAEFARARGLIGNGTYAEALPLLVTMVSKNPDDPLAPEVQFTLAGVCRDMGDLERAMAEYEKLVRVYPASPRVPDALIGRVRSEWDLAGTEFNRAPAVIGKVLRAVRKATTTKTYPAALQLRLITALQAVQEQYAGTPHALEALRLMVTVCTPPEMSNDRLAAECLVQLSKLDAEAGPEPLYEAARLYDRKLAEPSVAFQLYTQLQSRFPENSHAAIVRERLAALRVDPP